VKRGTVLALVLGAVVAAAAGGWMAGRRIVSPAEAASRARPPEPSLITVEVERRTLSADVIARGDIVFDDPVTVTLSGTLGAEGGAVVTGIPEEGAELAEGALLIEVSERPVFVLQGVIPSYRDLRPGAQGVDVLQIEQALARLGHLDEAPDETWTSATGAAVQAMYDQAGYRANGADETETAALEAARSRVTSAERAVADAQRAIEDASGAAKSEVLAAKAEAEAAHDAAELAEITARGANDAAARALATAESDLEDARAEADRAAKRLAQAEAGTHPDTGQPPTPAELADLRAAEDAAAKGVTTAETAVADAEQAVTQTEAEQEALVRQAKAAAEVADARLDEVLAPPDRSALVASRDAAAEELADARDELAELQASVGTWVPAGEIVFLKRVPVRVDSLAVTLGGAVSGPVMTVSGSEITMRVSVQEGDAPRLEVGDAVTVDEDSLETPLQGEITSIAEQAQGGRVAVEVALETVPADLIGANVKVVMPVESTAGEVLAVPAAALSATADGSARVEVEDEPGVTRFVEVVPGLAAEGLVEITPVNGEIAAGDRVVVGRADGDQPAGDEAGDETGDEAPGDTGSDGAETTTGETDG
jgi:multidrug efflux pump subunit AcrA (membrane-fusion protein)